MVIIELNEINSYLPEVHKLMGERSTGRMILCSNG
jgi:hypothetical protein